MAYNKEKDYKQFIKVWLKAKSLGKRYDYIATKLQVTEEDVSGTAIYLRNRGINLPSLKTTVDLDTTDMNVYINKALKNMGIK